MSQDDTSDMYLPGLEAGRTPLLLDEGHVSFEVVVHLEVGALVVDDCRDLLSARNSLFLGSARLESLTGGGCRHVGGLWCAEVSLAIARQTRGLEHTHELGMFVLCM